MTLPEPSHPAAVLLPFGLFMAILGVALVAPGLGVVLSVLTPAPLILLSLQQGKNVGLFSVGAVFLALWMLVGANQAIVFAASYAVVAVVLAETIRNRFPCGAAIGFAGLASAVLSGFLLWAAFSAKDISVVNFFEEQLQQNAAESIKAMEAAGSDPKEVEMMKGVADRYSEILAGTYPALLVVGSFLAAVVNYAVVRALWGRFYPPVYFQDPGLTFWVLPDQTVWVFILSAALSFLGGEGLRLLGMNVLIVILVLYLLQGLSIAFHILKAKRVPGLVGVLILALVLSQPMLIGLVIGLGLFDVWVDFRKIRPKAAGRPGEGQDEDENS